MMLANLIFHRKSLRLPSQPFSDTLQTFSQPTQHAFENSIFKKTIDIIKKMTLSHDMYLIGQSIKC